MTDWTAFQRRAIVAATLAERHAAIHAAGKRPPVLLAGCHECNSPEAIAARRCWYYLHTSGVPPIRCTLVDGHDDAHDYAR